MPQTSITGQDSVNCSIQWRCPADQSRRERGFGAKPGATRHITGSDVDSRKGLRGMLCLVTGDKGGLRCVGAHRSNCVMFQNMFFL